MFAKKIEGDLDDLVPGPPVVMLGEFRGRGLKNLSSCFTGDVELLLVDTPGFGYEPNLSCLQERGRVVLHERYQRVENQARILGCNQRVDAGIDIISKTFSRLSNSSHWTHRNVGLPERDGLKY